MLVWVFRCSQLTVILGSSCLQHIPHLAMNFHMVVTCVSLNNLLTFCIGIYISPHISYPRRVPNLKLTDSGS